MASKVAMIKNYCIDCVASVQSTDCTKQELKEIMAEIKACKATKEECNLWPRRMGGKFDYGRGDEYRTAEKLMAAECKLCMGSDSALIRECARRCFFEV